MVLGKWKMGNASAFLVATGFLLAASGAQSDGRCEVRGAAADQPGKGYFPGWEEGAVPD